VPFTKKYRQCKRPAVLGGKCNHHHKTPPTKAPPRDPRKRVTDETITDLVRVVRCVLKGDATLEDLSVSLAAYDFKYR
jgi:hypothetical protein